MANDGRVLDQEVIQPIDPDQGLMGAIVKGKRRAQANKDSRKKLRPEMFLWAEVIKQAVEDLQRPKYQDEARRWLLSNEFGTGTLLWICEQLGLNVLEVRDMARVNKHPRPTYISGKTTRKTAAEVKRETPQVLA